MENLTPAGEVAAKSILESLTLKGATAMAVAFVAEKLGVSASDPAVQGRRRRHAPVASHRRRASAGPRPASRPQALGEPVSNFLAQVQLVLAALGAFVPLIPDKSRAAASEHLLRPC